MKINADNIKWVNNNKYLGIQIASCLAWDDEIKTINIKVSGAVGLFKCAKKFLNNDILCKTYRGLVEPYLAFARRFGATAGET